MNLTASYLTLAGNAFGQPTRHGIIARSHAAAAAGYAGIGVLVTEPWQHVSPRDLPCPVTELEWAELASPFTHADAQRFADAADHFRTVTRINAGCGIAGATNVSDTDVARRLVTLATMAATRRIMIALEPVAFGAMWNPARIMRVLYSAGRPNTGLLYDTWHMTRAAAMGATATVPARMIAEVQLSGYTSTPDAFTGAMNRGPVDASAIAQLTSLQRHGYTGPIDIETTNATYRAMRLDAMAYTTIGGLA